MYSIVIKILDLSIKSFDDYKSHLYKFGIHLLSHIVSNIVPSAV